MYICILSTPPPPYPSISLHFFTPAPPTSVYTTLSQYTSLPYASLCIHLCVRTHRRPIIFVQAPQESVCCPLLVFILGFSMPLIWFLGCWYTNSPCNTDTPLHLQHVLQYTCCSTRVAVHLFRNTCHTYSCCTYTDLRYNTCCSTLVAEHLLRNTCCASFVYTYTNSPQLHVHLLQYTVVGTRVAHTRVAHTQTRPIILAALAVVDCPHNSWTHIH